MIYHKSFY